MNRPSIPKPFTLLLLEHSPHSPCRPSEFEAMRVLGGCSRSHEGVEMHRSAFFILLCLAAPHSAVAQHSRGALAFDGLNDRVLATYHPMWGLGRTPLQRGFGPPRNQPSASSVVGRTRIMTSSRGVLERQRVGCTFKSKTVPLRVLSIPDGRLFVTVLFIMSV